MTRLHWVDGLLAEVTDPDRRRPSASPTTTTATWSPPPTRSATPPASSATPPAGSGRRSPRPAHRTTYTYAPPGCLASRRDPDGAVWRFEHTTAGRSSAIDRPDRRPHRDRARHPRRGDPHHRPAGPRGHPPPRRPRQPRLGRAARRRPLGVRPRRALPAGRHDRPHRRHLDPEHDAAGDLAGTVDPTGVRDAVATDPPSGTRRASTTARRRRAPASTRSAGSVAAEQRRRLRRPDHLRPLRPPRRAASTPRAASPGSSRDAAGRAVEVISSHRGDSPATSTTPAAALAAVIDPLGARTTIDYDADSRLVADPARPARSRWTDYDACGRVVATATPGRRRRALPLRRRRSGRRVLRHLVRAPPVPLRRRRPAGRGRQRQRRRHPLRLRRQRPRRRDHRPAGPRHPPRVRRHEPLRRRDRPARPHHPRRLRRRRAPGLAGGPRRPPHRRGPTTRRAGASTVAVDGRTVAAIDARPARPRRSRRPTDTAADGREVVHELEWNRARPAGLAAAATAAPCRGPTTPTAAAPR